MNWIDYLLLVSALAGFLGGIAGAGIINMLVHLSAVAVCAAAGYTLAFPAEGGAAADTGHLIKGVVVFLICFAGWLAVKKAAGAIPGVKTAARIVDGLAGTAVAGAAAVIMVAAAAQRVDGVSVAAERSVVYQTVIAVAYPYGERAGGEIPWKK